MGALQFLAPWVLLGLLVLPILWWLLRATPPAPTALRFPGVGLLLGLQDAEKMPDRTPIWLLILRLLAVAAAIVAFAKPVVNIENQLQGQGPLLVLMDGGWASAPDWVARITAVENLLETMSRAGRPTVFISLAQPLPAGNEMPFRDARDWVGHVQALAPQPWAPERANMLDWLQGKPDSFETYWLSDGLAHDGTDLATELAARGPLHVLGTDHALQALQPLTLEDGNLLARVIALPGTTDRKITVSAIGKSPDGAEVTLAVVQGILPASETTASLVFELPLELRNRVERVILRGQNSAGAVTLAADGLRRRKVALVGVEGQEGASLILPMHYLRKALEPSVALIEGDLSAMLLSAPDVIILSDVGTLAQGSRAQLLEWVKSGGLLVRFAGPKLAASINTMQDDPLLPVRLRAGGRTLGGALSWETPKELQEFPENSPFFGLPITNDVQVRTQVIAEPAPYLTDRTLALLEDGTPLVTQIHSGNGRVVLFHTTANAEWSNLPLSGLFVQMLERLSISASGVSDKIEPDARMWTPTQVLDGFGVLHTAKSIPPVSGERLSTMPVGADAPAGIYQSGDQRVAVNVLTSEDGLTALNLPLGYTIEPLIDTQMQAYMAWLLLLALGLLMMDILATLWISGKLSNRGALRAASLCLLLGWMPVDKAQAEDTAAIRATAQTVFAYVLTGDAAIDRTSAAGLLGLSAVLHNRTSVEPAAPVAIDIETDELTFYPFLYWPVSEHQADLSPAAILRINRYLAHGGMILFDTRDAHLGRGSGNSSLNGPVLQRLTANLDIPLLAPVAKGHVITRAFYLLKDFPGRWFGPPLWVEIPSHITTEQNFGSTNDGVTPVMIGANDWAAAWAINDLGQPMFPVGRGLSGKRQREMARRFGINLVMYVLTGNYKSDQVHIPALLERLGE